jgi:signal transduction histidine kinase
MQPKILLVDDRQDNMLSIEAILQTDHYAFIKAESGRSALKVLLQQYDFALILMDVNMPSLNGFETASLIFEREKLRHIPIIFITAHHYGEENVFKGYRLGAVDYIYKPINPELLRAKVGVFVELYKKNHRLLLQEQKLISINKNLESEINERRISEEKVKELNHELLQNIDRLEAANKELDRFAFMASHDLQEPLRKIRTFTDRLSNKYENLFDDDGKKYFERIQKAAERMQTLINDIFTFSKISSEKDAFVRTDLNVVVNDVIAEMESVINQKKVCISVEALPSLFVNPSLIRPLFNNLISNAVKYSKEHVDPVIKIYAEQDHDSEGPEAGFKNKYCRIYVEDNGIGFEQQNSEKIFGMFVRLHSINEYEGTGIGLALCKKIVEDHNGYISARSKVGEGSTFIIALPLDSSKKKIEKVNIPV